MNRRVAIVTDSTSSVPDDVAHALNIAMVQMELTVGDHVNDESRIAKAEVAQALEQKQTVETAPPPPPAFYWNYMDAVSDGAEAIISVHISSTLSETSEAARIAAAEIKVPVYVVDSRMIGLGLGYPVIAAAEAAGAGVPAQGVLGVLDRQLRATTQMLYVDTLEYLQRSGRVSLAQAKIGKALSIKPLLILSDGTPQPLARGFGQGRTISRAVSVASKRAGSAQVDVGVEHFHAPERAKDLVNQLRRAIPNVRRVLVGECSAAIGAHIGPGAVGITVSPV